MNQILMMGNEPPKKDTKKQNEQTKTTNNINMQKKQIKPSIQRANQTSNKADLGKVVKFFCIIIIIFGLILTGKSTYAIIANRERKKDVIINAIADQMGKETKITVETGYPIKEFIYRWNDGEPVTIQGNGTVVFETVLQIPNGNNILNMTVKDYYGYEHTLHNKQYLYESTDVNKPVIEMGTRGTKISVTATDDTEMSYITYKWNDEEATRIDMQDDDENKQKITAEIEVPEGQNKLTIIAADKEGNRETRTENIVGDTKPEFSIMKDGLSIIVVAKDDQGISRIVIKVDDQTTDSGEEPINRKEVTAKLNVESGTHTITVTVTNVNGLSDSKTITAEI